MTILRPLMALGLALLLGACAAPGNQAADTTPAPGAPVADAAGADDPAERGDATAPVHRGPIPGAPTLGNPGTGGSTVDRSCSTDADCTVKNVGNCCGYYPACVNVDSPTDPEGVRAKCAAEGRAGVCGFPEIAGCQCVQGTCQDQRREAIVE